MNKTDSTRKKFLKKVLFLFPANGTPAAQPPHQSKFLREGVRGRALFEKSALPPSPTRKNFDWWGGSAAEVPLCGKKRTSRSLLPLYLFLLERSGGMPFLNSPLRNFQRKTVPELPGGNLQHRAEDAGNRPQDEKEKAGTQRWVPAFSCIEGSPCGGAFSSVYSAPLSSCVAGSTITRRICLASASSTMNRQPPHSKISPFSGTCPASRHR